MAILKKIFFFVTDSTEKYAAVFSLICPCSQSRAEHRTRLSYS